MDKAETRSTEDYSEYKGRISAADSQGTEPKDAQNFPSVY
jgi:hypothetical protein